MPNRTICTEKDFREFGKNSLVLGIHVAFTDVFFDICERSILLGDYGRTNEHLVGDLVLKTLFNTISYFSINFTYKCFSYPDPVRLVGLGIKYGLGEDGPLTSFAKYASENVLFNDKLGNFDAFLYLTSIQMLKYKIVDHNADESFIPYAILSCMKASAQVFAIKTLYPLYYDAEKPEERDLEYGNPYYQPKNSSFTIEDTPIDVSDTSHDLVVL